MKKIYLIKFTLESNAQQPEILQLLKSDGAEVIQTSGGLCVKTEKSESETRAIMGKFAESVSIEPLSKEGLKDQAESVKAFVAAE